MPDAPADLRSLAVVVIFRFKASESSSYQSELEQVLSRETLRLPGVQVTTCNPINASGYPEPDIASSLSLYVLMYVFMHAYM